MRIPPFGRSEIRFFWVVCWARLSLIVVKCSINSWWTKNTPSTALWLTRFGLLRGELVAFRTKLDGNRLLYVLRLLRDPKTSFKENHGEILILFFVWSETTARSYPTCPSINSDRSECKSLTLLFEKTLLLSSYSNGNFPHIISRTKNY